MEWPELHIISTGRQHIESLAEITKKIEPYVDFFHLREKQMGAQQLYEAVSLLTARGIPLSKIIINDRADVAWAVNAYGVQLAFHSLDARVVKKAFPGLKVGSSIHSVQEAQAAFLKKADYGVFGHIFQTSSKTGLTPKGLEELKNVTEQTKLPVIAIGGIKPSNCREVLLAGACGIAVMSGVLEAENPLQMVKEYSKCMGREM